MRAKYPHAHISVATFDKTSTIVEVGEGEYVPYFPNGIKKHPIKNIIYFLRQMFAISRSDLLVIGGGGIFFDNETGISFDKILWEWKIRLFFARLFRSQVCFLNVSIEVREEENLRKLKNLFSVRDIILVRDLPSAQKLAQIAVESEVIGDSVFLLPPESPPLTKRKQKTIGFALRAGFLDALSEQELGRIV